MTTLSNITISNIMTYSNPADLIRDYLPETLEDLNPDELDALRHLVDFEPARFHVINDEQVAVVDSLCGDIMGSLITIEEYARASIEAAKEMA